MSPHPPTDIEKKGHIGREISYRLRDGESDGTERRCGTGLAGSKGVGGSLEHTEQRLHLLRPLAHELLLGEPPRRNARPLPHGQRVGERERLLERRDELVRGVRVEAYSQLVFNVLCVLGAVWWTGASYPSARRQRPPQCPSSGRRWRAPRRPAPRPGTRRRRCQSARSTCR